MSDEGLKPRPSGRGAVTALADYRAAMGEAVADGVVSPAQSGEIFCFRAEVVKVDESLGLVLGWAIICTDGGQPYFDTQDDHIPETSMLKAASRFMQNSRTLGDMHQTAEGGSVVFAFPLTADIASAFGLITTKTGLMIGVKPASAETLQKFRDGTYTGFSIGGRRVIDEDAD